MVRESYQVWHWTLSLAMANNTKHIMTSPTHLTHFSDKSKTPRHVQSPVKCKLIILWCRCLLVHILYNSYIIGCWPHSGLTVQYVIGHDRLNCQHRIIICKVLCCVSDRIPRQQSLIYCFHTNMQNITFSHCHFYIGKQLAIYSKNRQFRRKTLICVFYAFIYSWRQTHWLHCNGSSAKL